MKNLFIGTLLIFAVLSFAATAQAQTGLRNSVDVSKPTRLDWKFAASGFGKGAATLPADYDSAKQKYLLYVPKNYDAKRTWPLVLFISPGNSPAGWRNWQKTCETNAVLFCSPYAAGNRTPLGQRTRIVLDVLDDVRRYYRIDPDRTYISGFSGGGRMSCTIGYALPEYFGGVVPVCGTNPLPQVTYLRHRVEDRLSVAFLTGEKDFNRKENEVWMFPYFKDLGIRTKLTIVPKMGHSIPGTKTMDDVYAWLEKDLKKRRADRQGYPGLQSSADTTYAANEQAGHQLQTAQSDLANPNRVWRGVTLLQGILKRWPKTAAGAKARGRLQQVLKNQKLLLAVDKQGGADERKFLFAQAKGLDRFGLRERARKAWRMLAKYHPNSPEGKHAAKMLKQ